MERIAISLPIRLYMHIAYGIWKHRHTKPVVLYILYIHIYIYLHTHTHTHTYIYIYTKMKYHYVPIRVAEIKHEYWQH